MISFLVVLLEKVFLCYIIIEAYRRRTRKDLTLHSVKNLHFVRKRYISQINKTLSSGVVWQTIVFKDSAFYFFLPKTGGSTPWLNILTSLQEKNRGFRNMLSV